MKALACWAALVAAFAISMDAAAAEPLPAGVTRGPVVEGISEYRLANGLQVLFAPDSSKPTTTVNTTYLVGSRNENYGETGMAHLLEHLMFKGSPKYPQVWKEFTARGMRANGTTWTDRTNYFASFTAKDADLDWYLRWSADAMTHSFIARKDLDSEMTVVRNELEMGENSPGRSLLKHVLGAAYQWHSYGKDTIGARSDVENVNIERLQAFYRKYYQPDNAVLIVTGKFDEAKALATIAGTFGKIPRPARKIEPTYTLDPAQDGERSVTVRRVGDTQLALAAYHTPAGSSPDFAAFSLLATILGDTPTGRLHQALVETKQAASTFAFTMAFKEPGLILVGAQLPPADSMDTARSTLVATVESFSKTPVTAAEVERARAKYLKNFELTASDPEQVGVALSNSISQGDWRLFFLQRDRVRDIKVQDVQRVAAAYLIPDNRTLGLYIPTANPQRPPAPEFADVAPMVKDYRGGAAVVEGEKFDATPQNIESRAQRFTLGDGMKVAFVPKRTRGATVNASLVFLYGDEKALLGTSSVRDMTAAMLDRGTQTMSRGEIRDALDRLKARVSAYAYPGGAVVAVDITAKRDGFLEVLKIVADMLRRPSFPATEFEQLKKEYATQIEAQRREPNSVGYNALERQGNPYRPGDVRYAQSFDEQLAEVGATTLEQVKGLHARFYGGEYSYLAIVGDFDPASTKALLSSLFGDWKSGAPYTRVPRPLFEPAPASLKFETPDKAQAFFGARLGFPMQDNSPEYAAVMVANRMLGGEPSSVLWQRIREKDGLSYGVYSQVYSSPYEPRTQFDVNAILAPQNLAKLEAAFNEEIERIRKDGFSAEKLKDAKAGMLQARKLEYAQDGSVSNSLVQHARVNRTLDFDAELDREIEAVTLDQVNAVFRKYVDPAKLVTVRAGDFAKAAAK
jgi:zinc protease